MNTMETLKDPAFWQAVRENDCYQPFRELLHKTWEDQCCQSIQEVPYSKIKRYFETGDRRTYESDCFGRRQALVTAAVLSAIYPNEPKYLQRTQDLLWAMCGEYCWATPAHFPAAEKLDPIHMDLFAAEMGMTLSQIYRLLENRLDPIVKRRICEELDRRIIVPYTNRTFFFETYRSNWTAVCTACVATVFVLMHPDLAQEQLERFEQGAANYLSGFGEDGFCQEGFLYWTYGFGFFVIYADLILGFTQGKIDHFRDPKVERIAAFFQKKYINGEAEVSFSDAEPDVRYPLGQMHYLKKEYPQTILLPPLHLSNVQGSWRCADFLYNIVWFDAALAACPDDMETSSVHYGPDAQWLICRNKAFGFAAKAGHNAEPHNHNDVGSFQFAKSGKNVLVDPGRGQYTRDYFRNETRYTIFQPSSRGHSVPIIGTQHQKFGTQYAAKDVRWEDGTFSFDMAACYDVPELTALRRSFTVTDSGVTLTDRFAYTGAEQLTERLVTTCVPQIGDGVILLADAVLSFDPARCTVTVSTETPLPNKNPDGQESKAQTYYLIDFTLRPGVDSFTLSMV